MYVGRVKISIQLCRIRKGLAVCRLIRAIVNSVRHGLRRIGIDTEAY